MNNKRSTSATCLNTYIDQYDADTIIQVDNVDYIVTLLLNGTKTIVPYSSQTWHQDVYHIHPNVDCEYGDIDEDFYRDFIREFQQAFPDVQTSRKEEFKLCKLLWNKYKSTFKMCN